MRADVPSRRAASVMRMAPILTILCQEHPGNDAATVGTPLACKPKTRMTLKGRTYVRGSASVPGCRPGARRLRAQGDPADRARDALADGSAEGIRAQPAAARRQDHRKPAHDDPDCTADREPNVRDL